MNSRLKEALEKAVQEDSSILVGKEEVKTSLGQDARYLKSLGIEKSHLIRLERLGLAIKARYQTTNKTGRWKFFDENKEKVAITGPHRTRWLILKEALE